MQVIEGATTNSKANLSPVSDIIHALQNILARSQSVTVCRFRYMIGCRFIDDEQIPDLETPYCRLPNTDQTAIPKGQRLISTIITERQQQLDAVLHEISGLETVMDGIKNLHQQLVEKKDRITQSMNLHKGLGSALWRLPNELLSHIFVYCLPEAKYLSPESEPPMLLTRICRRWREVALGIPSLWCRLCMEFVNNSDWQWAAVRYNSWLKRSRGCPLSLELHCDADDLTKLRSLLRPYINQISSLSIKISVPGTQPELLLKDLPALQELTIWWNHDDPPIAQSISRLPSTLRSLLVGESWFDVGDISSSNPVWAHLINVQIDIIRPNAFLHLLQLCPNLSSLAVSTDFPQIQTQPLEPFTHTKLRFLGIDSVFLGAHSLPVLFDALSLPNLRVFETCEVIPWPHEAVKALLVRSKCPLESLIFSGRRIATITDEQRAEYTALFPSLEIVSTVYQT
ncbi:uncharacterized protein EDB91DRAFT_68185 [Suillus paluster]|uniref:uncharacterized protein n=1 Tax=Suillus paluster TaxID=48578 RepID=UPI001B85C139|nr:uncharacterized protein EDB91DRAFT_68185 [Suillus paluster]KAG1747097.1 hypothetical protein EDB91DRAFT_68185 [Suillus paluster]